MCSCVSCFKKWPPKVLCLTSVAISVSNVLCAETSPMKNVTLTKVHSLLVELTLLVPIYSFKDPQSHGINYSVLFMYANRGRYKPEHQPLHTGPRTQLYLWSWSLTVKQTKEDHASPINTSKWTLLWVLTSVVPLWYQCVLYLICNLEWKKTDLTHH